MSFRRETWVGRDSRLCEFNGRLGRRAPRADLHFMHLLNKRGA
jgi:hypothetical protein